MNGAVDAGNDRFLLAMLVASALHILVIFAVSFDAFEAGPPRQQVEVTLVQTPGQRPRIAEHIAQSDQTGSGKEALRDLAAGQPNTLPQPSVPMSAQQPLETSGRERLSSPAITSTEARQKIIDRRGIRDSRSDLPASDSELARLNQELARLQADLDAQRQPASRRARVRRLDAVSARAAVDAAYLADWRRRVEAVGNQYYPEASLRYGIFGSLEMLVTVRSNGTLDGIRILKSSGYAVLDEAAVRIVRTAAPFAPFPDELRETTDKLEIVRTWQFEQNPLSSK